MTKRWAIIATTSLATLLAIFSPARVIRADIFKWEYVNPANPSQGKQQSTTLASDGAGASAAPGANLSNRNLTMAYLIGADLSPYSVWDDEGSLISTVYADLSAVNLSQADLTDARLGGAILTGSNFTNAEVRGTSLVGTAITAAQLYSTASYQAHNLSQIDLGGVNLAGWNFAGQNVTNASFYQATLTNANLSQSNLTNATLWFANLADANLTGAEVRGASFYRDNIYFLGGGITAAQLASTASHQVHDLTGIKLDGNDLTGGDLVGQDLSRATFFGATLTGANMAGAQVRGTNFNRDMYYNFGTGLTVTQLSSTASYQAQELTGIGLNGNDLTGANLSGQNLTSANLGGAKLTGANLSQANLMNANLSMDLYGYIPTDLTGANLTGADARGARFDFISEYATLTGANTTNLVWPHGNVAGLNLTSGALLVVRDYDGNPAAYPTPTGPLPIVVEQHLAMDATGTLRLVFDADAWDSTISFAAGIPVTRAGTLDLTFAPGVDVATQSGRTIDLFDWTGVTPTGAFTISSPYNWNLSNLYTTGEVTLTALPAIPGDFNHDGTVEAADYVAWRKTGGSTDDYNEWQTNFGAMLDPGGGAIAGSLNETVPEPAGALLMLVGAVLATSLRR